MFFLFLRDINWRGTTLLVHDDRQGLPFLTEHTALLTHSRVAVVFKAL